MPSGSWMQAELQCRSRGATLWTINSFTEWWNILLLLGAGIHGPDDVGLFNIDSIQVITSTLSFTGLIRKNSVSISTQTENHSHCWHFYCDFGILL